MIQHYKVPIWNKNIISIQKVNKKQKNLDNNNFIKNEINKFNLIL